MKKYHQVKTGLTQFVANEGGGVLPLLGLAFACIVMAAGAAMDYGRAQMIRDRLQSAIDASALAAARYAHTGDLGRVQAEANRYFAANFPSTYGVGSVNTQFIGTVNGRGQGVRVWTEGVNVKSNLAHIFGGNEYTTVKGLAEVNTQPITPMDLVFSLDMSGSMAWKDDTSATCRMAPVPAICHTPPARIEGAKAALHWLIALLGLPGNRFGIVGWDSKVNISGQLAGLPGTHYVAGDLPSSVDTGNAVASNTFGGGMIRPLNYLTSDFAWLHTEVDNIVVDHNTDGSNGMLWALRQFENHHFGGWNNWAGVAPNRVIVFMTDGINTEFYEMPGGSASAVRGPANAKQIFWCNWAKNLLGIRVYTIAYNLPAAPTDLSDVDVILTLSACASQPNFFFNAQNGSEIIGIFQTIASHMQTMRLTR